MSRLFISLYLDEDVSVLVARLIRSRGFSARTTHEEGRLGASDRDQLDFACRHELALVTHNRLHFQQLAQDYSAEGRSHTGILISVRRSPYEIARRLLLLMNRITAEEMDNRLLYL